jgi:hypothetical protein
VPEDDRRPNPWRNHEDVHVRVVDGLAADHETANTPEELTPAIFEWIEAWYIATRRYSVFGKRRHATSESPEQAWNAHPTPESARRHPSPFTNPPSQSRSTVLMARTGSMWWLPGWCWCGERHSARLRLRRAPRQ